MVGFAKLVPEIVQSSIWNEKSDIRIVWITLLAIKDKNGYVRGDTQVISRMANVSIEATTQALDKFQQPDPNSHIPDNEGRRITPAPGGWVVLNHLIYRLRDTKENHAEYMRKWRGKNGDVNKCDSEVNNSSVSVSASKSVSSPKRVTTRFVKPTPEEVAEYASTIGFNLDGNKFYDHYEAKGWVIGKSPMKSWQSAVRYWKSSQAERQSSPTKPPTWHELKSKCEHVDRRLDSLRDGKEHRNFTPLWVGLVKAKKALKAKMDEQVKG